MSDISIRQNENRTSASLLTEESSNIVLTPEEQIELLTGRLEQAELEATDRNIALIEMTAARNALYKSLQDTQMRLAEMQGQHQNDMEAYQKELAIRLAEKRELQEKCDELAIKARRYDELQESLVKIKMDAEIRAHGVIDEAQEKALDTIMLIDNIENEIKLFREDLTFLRRDIKIGTVTLDDRLENVSLRLCQNLDKLTKIRKNFCLKNAIPMSQVESAVPETAPPNHIQYSEQAETPLEANEANSDNSENK